MTVSLAKDLKQIPLYEMEVGLEEVPGRTSRTVSSIVSHQRTRASSSVQLYTSLQDLPDDTIRLISLRSGKVSSRIKENIFLARLAVDPVYTVLSHKWGSGADGYELIWLNEVEIAIRKNLWHLGKRLQCQQDSSCFWVDAACIYRDRHRNKYCRKLRLEPLF